MNKYSFWIWYTRILEFSAGKLHPEEFFFFNFGYMKINIQLSKFNTAALF